MLYTFAEFELDEDRFELRRDAAPVPVQGKVLEILLCLIRHRERLVTKEDLIRHGWGEIAVSEASLSHAVMMARRCLGDDGQDQRFIQTVRGRGYRFVGEVHEKPAKTRSDSPPGVHAIIDPAPLSDVTLVAGPHLVGRSTELTELVESLESAMQGRGGLVLLTGEPGIGKTTLAERLRGEAHARGVPAYRGRCWDGDAAPVLWPWIQMLRAHVESHAGTEMPSLVSESRFAVFDTLVRFWRQAAKEQPIVLVLDDLHAADEASVRLLAFFAGALADARVLVIGCARDLEACGDAAPAAAEALDSLLRARPSGSKRLALQGLAQADIARMLEGKVGQKAAISLASSVRDATSGNPFFVEEFARRLPNRARFHETVESEDRVPDTLAATVRGRLDPLPRATLEVLGACAVIGQDVSLALARDVCGEGAERILDAMRPALKLGILCELRHTIASYTFCNTLVREAIYRGLSPDARMRLHGRVAHALERTAGPHAPTAAELAHHFAQAAPLGEIEKAVAYCELAANQAISRGDYQEAADHYDRALAVLSLGSDAGARQRELVVALNDVQDRADRAGVLGFREETRESGVMMAESLADISGVQPALTEGGIWLEERQVGT